MSLILFPTCIVVNDIHFWSDKVNQRVPRRHEVLTHGQKHLFCKVTSVSIHSFVEWFDTFSYVLQPADVTVKEVIHIRRFAIGIAKDLILLSCRRAMEHLCVLELETALATLVTTWFTLVDRRWRFRYRSSDLWTLVSDPTSRRFIRWLLCQTLYIYTYIHKWVEYTDQMDNSSWRSLDFDTVQMNNSSSLVVSLIYEPWRDRTGVIPLKNYP